MEPKPCIASQSSGVIHVDTASHHWPENQRRSASLSVIENHNVDAATACLPVGFRLMAARKLAEEQKLW